MDERLKLALDLARKSGTIIRDNFGKTHVIELKGDMSPVTAIDKQINTLIAQSLRIAFPEDGLLGEEESYGTGSEQYQWICDPLDGTKPFILELPFSVFMLGLSEDGNMLLSVVYDPYSDKMYHAVKDNGAYCNNVRIHVSSEKINEGYALVGADSFSFAAKLKGLSRGIEPVPGTGYKCVMLASGRGIGMINDSADFHDIGPGSLLVEEAGGKVTGLHGEQLDYSKEISGAILSNNVVHADLLKIAASVD